jgi:hypothetical protein
MRNPYVSLWLPIDFYFAISASRRRLLEVPTFLIHTGRKDYRAFRFECCLLLQICIILDVKKVRLNAVNRFSQ